MYYGDAVVVFAGGVSMEDKTGVAVGGQLKGAAEVVTCGIEVAIDEDNLCITVVANHIAEETFVGLDAMTEDEDAGCVTNGLGGAIPYVDIMF